MKMNKGDFVKFTFNCGLQLTEHDHCEFNRLELHDAVKQFVRKWLEEKCYDD